MSFFRRCLFESVIILKNYLYLLYQMEKDILNLHGDIVPHGIYLERRVLKEARENDSLKLCQYIDYLIHVGMIDRTYAVYILSAGIILHI